MKRIIYPGTFDPIHNGHLDIAKRAAELFDELVLVVAVNKEKNLCIRIHDTHLRTARTHTHTETDRERENIICSI